MTELIDYCMEQEAICACGEYATADHGDKAEWHEQRWLWLERALRLLNGVEIPVSEKWIPAGQFYPSRE